MSRADTRSREQARLDEYADHDNVDQVTARLHQILDEHRGEANAIPRQDLEQQLPCKLTSIRDHNAILRSEYDIPVAYSYREDGYYIIDSQTELDRVLDRYQGEIESRRESIRTVRTAYHGGDA